MSSYQHGSCKKRKLEPSNHGCSRDLCGKCGMEFYLLWKVDQRIKGMFGRISLCFFPGMQVAQCAERPWDENFNPKLTVATMKSPWCHLVHTSVCPAKPFQNATWTKIWNLAWLWSRTVRVQQGTLRSSACSWGPAEEAALDEEAEDQLT